MTDMSSLVFSHFNVFRSADRARQQDGTEQLQHAKNLVSVFLERRINTHFLKSCLRNSVSSFYLPENRSLDVCGYPMLVRS